MKIAGINFDHFHMGDLLRSAYDHPTAEIVGIAMNSRNGWHSAAQFQHSCQSCVHRLSAMFGRDKT